MKVKGFWLVVVALAAGALGAFLFRGCGKTKTVTWCPPVDMDSLRATIPPDTILVPGSQVVKFIPEKVNLKDTAAIDSLLRQFQEMQGYYAGLTDQLKNAIGRKDSAVANAQRRVEELELLIRTNEYSDSVATDTYTHHWRIIAEGPIRSYTYGIVPIFPPQPTIPKTRLNRVAVYIGGHVDDGAIRPLYELEYSRRWLQGKAGYLPRSKALAKEPAFQLSAGVNIRF